MRERVCVCQRRKVEDDAGGGSMSLVRREGRDPGPWCRCFEESLAVGGRREPRDGQRGTASEEREKEREREAREQLARAGQRLKSQSVSHAGLGAWFLVQRGLPYSSMSLGTATAAMAGECK